VEIAPKGLDRYRMKPFSTNSSLHVPLTFEADSEDEHLHYRQGQPFHKGGHQLFKKVVSTCGLDTNGPIVNCLFTS